MACWSDNFHTSVPHPKRINYVHEGAELYAMSSHMKWYVGENFCLAHCLLENQFRKCSVVFNLGATYKPRLLRGIMR